MRTNIKRIKFVCRKDRLSDLHDDILLQILSFLHVKSAAQTCVLSTRWNNKLWIQHPDVYLNHRTFGENSYKFKEFVDMVLTQRDKLHHKIRSFSLNWTFKAMIPQQLLDKVHAYVQYHDIQHLDLTIGCCASRSTYSSQNFNPKSLTTLRLNLPLWYQESLCTDVNLHVLPLYLSGCTALKTLWLQHITIEISSGDVDLFSSLTDLRELHIIGCNIIGEDGPFLVSAPRLERLTILENISESKMTVPRWEISSRVLKYLRTDLLLSKRTINHLPRYIEELEIDFLSLTNYRTESHAKWLINKIRCLPDAKSVTLSKSTLQVISAFPDTFKSTVLQFDWKFLKVKTTNELPTKEFPKYLQGLAALTKNCLETLKVEFV